jgi:transcriptional regulator with XRE-family HTH domain
MITAAQMRAARALLGLDQRQLAELSGVSLQTIQRMEGSEGNVRGIVDTLTKVVEALDTAGVELIGENVRSLGDGRGVRFKQAARATEAIFGQKLLQRRSQFSVANGQAAKTPRKT